MKKFRVLLLFFASVMCLFSCKSDDIAAIEDAQIEGYVATNKLVVTEKTSSGLRYIRTVAGTGAALINGQNVTVKYVGKLLSGTQFDAGTFGFKLGAGTVIKGFDEGIAKMKVGEKAILIFPSSIGYGAAGAGSIPANAPLAFEIEILAAK